MKQNLFYKEQWLFWASTVYMTLLVDYKLCLLLNRIPYWEIKALFKDEYSRL